MDDQQDHACLPSVAAFLRHQDSLGLVPFDPGKFIDLRVRRCNPGQSAEPSDTADPDGLKKTGPVRFSVQIESLLRRPDQRIVLSGVSGAGKTVTLGTLTKRLSNEALEAVAAGRMPDTIPVWLPAARLPVEPIGSPVSWVSGLFEQAGVYEGAENAARSILSQGRLLLVIDSLQEVLTFSRGRTSALGHLVNLPGIRLVASIRPGYEYLVTRPSAVFLQLQGLDHPEREQILRLREVAAERSGALRRLVLKPRLCRAVEVPQIWQMAIDLQSRGIDVEHMTSEAKLYREFVLDVLRRHTADDDTGSAGATYDPTDLSHVLELLGGACTFGRTRALGLDECEGWITQWLSARSKGRGVQYDSGIPRNLLHDLPRFYHPVLGFSQDRKEISFAHGSLACFLAAEWIRRTCRIMPPELLMDAALIDVVAFYAELHEIQEGDVQALDQQLIRFGSVEFLCRWLKEITTERILILGETLRERITASTARECWELVDTLSDRGLSLARSLLLSLDAEADDWRADIIKTALGPRPTRSQSRRAAERIRLGRLSKERQKRLNRIRKKQASSRMVSRLDDLLSALATCRNDTEKIDVLERIAASGQTGPSERIRPCFYSSNTYVIRSAVEAAATLGDPSVVKDIIPLLGHRQPHICSAAAKALGFLQDSSAVSHLMRMLQTSLDHHCINAAMDSLGLMGATEGGPKIRERLKSRDPYCRGSAARALGLIQDQDAVLMLVDLLDPKFEDNGVVRGSAATALGQLGDPRAVEPLIRSLDPKFETDGVNRGSAATALGQLGDPRAVEPLIRSTESEHDAVVRASASGARRRLQSLGDTGSGTDPLTVEDTRLHAAWERLFAQYLHNEAAPAPEHFDQELGLCLRSLEQWFGGRQFKKWHERDYETVLASLIEAGGRYHATCESVVADRQRTDILVYSKADYTCSLQAVLELKKCAPAEVRAHLQQLQEYVKSLNAPTPVRGYLLALDPSAHTDWTEADRAYEADGLQIRLVHVGRQPPSSARKNP